MAKDDPQLVALVGTTIEDKRFEPGDLIDAPLDERQRRYLAREGYAWEVPPKLSAAKRQAEVDRLLTEKQEG